MADFIVIRTLTEKMSKILWKFEKAHPEIVAMEISGQNKNHYFDAIKFYKDNGIVMTYISGLLEKYPMQLEVFGAKRISEVFFPAICNKGGKWLGQHNHNKFSLVAKNIGTTEEELMKLTLGIKIPVNSIKEEIEEMRKKTKQNRTDL